jgi:hypothetical protein
VNFAMQAAVCHRWDSVVSVVEERDLARLSTCADWAFWWFFLVSPVICRDNIKLGHAHVFTSFPVRCSLINPICPRYIGLNIAVQSVVKDPQETRLCLSCVGPCVAYCEVADWSASPLC